jgi:hypothetical protein
MNPSQSETSSPNGRSTERDSLRWKKWVKSFRCDTMVAQVLAELVGLGADEHHILSSLFLIPEEMNPLELRSLANTQRRLLGKAKRHLTTASAALSETYGEGAKPTEIRLGLSILSKRIDDSATLWRKYGSARSWDSTDCLVCTLCSYLSRFRPRAVY